MIEGPAGEGVVVMVGENMIVPNTAGGYEHIDLPLGEAPAGEGTSEAYNAMVSREFPENQAVMVGDNLIVPKSTGRYEHVDLPIGEEATPNHDVYNRMVERPGFPLAREDGTEQNHGVDISL